MLKRMVLKLWKKDQTEVKQLKSTIDELSEDNADILSVFWL